MERGEVRWAEYPPGQTHPVLLLSWDAHAGWRDRVTVAEVTGTVRDLDAEVALTPDDDGMPKECVVNLDAIVTIRRSRVGGLVATLSDARMREVEQAIHIALGIELPCSAV